MHLIPDVNIKNFDKGLITRVEKETVPRGAASDANNWLHLGDHIELRGGQKLIGTEITGSGKVTAVHVIRRFDGVEVAFYSHGRKVKYYDTTTEDWIETGSDILASDADGEDIAMESYHSLAGAFLYLSSPNSSIIKIPAANPGSETDLSSTDHRGKIRIKKNRMFLWDRKDTNGGSDKTGLYLSYIDKDELSDYTEVTDEAYDTGDGSEKTFANTLAAKAGNSKRTCMYVRITDGTETFIDDRNGVLVGDLGGTGTINYSTMAASVTFNTAPANLQAITSDYFHEDATSTGIADFSKSTPRTAGQGAVFRQDDADIMQNMGSIGDSEFCFHKIKTYDLLLSSDDTNATNLIYRNRVGIEYFRAMVETGEGIVFVESQDQAGPAVRILEKSRFTTDILPRSLSEQLDLTDYRFDLAWLGEWGDYLVLECRHKDSTVNNTTFLRHKTWKLWDKCDFRFTEAAIYAGKLWGGDVAGNNVFELFNGLTDEESNIPNHYITGNDNLDSEGVKVTNRFVLGGLIGIDQKIKMSISLDNGSFVEVGQTLNSVGTRTAFTIEGDASYVDQGQKTTIGSQTIGSGEIGGGSSGVEASPYRREFIIATDRFEFVRVKWEAVDIGYASISEYGFRDNRYKGRSLPTQYVT